MKVSSLNIYPVKSARAVALDHARVELEGLTGDRRWVIINADKRFISQRSHPDLARLEAAISETGTLSLGYDGEWIDVIHLDPDVTDLTVWNDAATGHLASDAVNDWLSDRLGERLYLVSMGEAGQRKHVNSRTGDVISVSYADGYPILITTEASLAALNDFLGETEPDLPMARFRPNIVIKGCDAWSEDSWAKIRIGGVEIDMVKPCTRCIITTLNPLTGESEGDAAMRAMVALRRSADPVLKGVLFGINAVPVGQGAIAVGDRVDILDRREPWPVSST